MRCVICTHDVPPDPKPTPTPLFRQLQVVTEKRNYTSRHDGYARVATIKVVDPLPLAPAALEQTTATWCKLAFKRAPSGSSATDDYARGTSVCTCGERRRYAMRMIDRLVTRWLGQACRFTAGQVAHALQQEGGRKLSGLNHELLDAYLDGALA